jgi:origin recognition complex subunit 2
MSTSEDESGSQTDIGFDATPRAGPAQSAVVKTAFDSYFLHFAKPAKTSPAVFSSNVEPLSADEYAAAIKSASSKYQLTNPVSVSLQRVFASHFRRFRAELEEGFNLMFYGYGSKRAILNRFASEVCSKRGHVVVVNGSQPKSSIKDLLATLESIPDLQNVPLVANSIEGQLRRIIEFFSPMNERPPLFLFIHNIDSAPFRTSKAKSSLSTLASSPRIHLVASVDHVNAPLLWSSSEISSRSREDDVGFGGSGLSLRGFSWLWHDMTTLASYDYELAGADRTSFAGAQSGGRGAKGDLRGVATIDGPAMTETAAQHILASVTQKAKKLFMLMATKQLAMMEEVGDVGSADELQRFALAYDTLFTTARDNFIATNDTALKSLLGEFRDHNLVVSSGSGTGEVLWIPLRKERLGKVTKALEAESV